MILVSPRPILTTVVYAYGRQPSAVIWNLQQLAGTLTHFAGQQDLPVAILQRYSPGLEQEIANAMFRRFGVKAPQNNNGQLDLDQANGILTRYFEGMRATGLSFQAPFFDLHGGGSERLADAQARQGEHTIQRTTRGRGSGNLCVTEKYRRPSGNL